MGEGSIISKELSFVRKDYRLLSNKLPITSFIFILESLDSVSLPFYTGSTFRGAFGISLKRVTCTLSRVNSFNRNSSMKDTDNPVNNDCFSCMFKLSCPYIRIFEGHADEELSSLKTIQTTIHPYILEPPFNSDSHIYSKGEEIEVGLNLVGECINDLPYFIAAFSEFERVGIGKSRGHLSLKSVLLKTANKTKPTIVYERNTDLLKDYKSKKMFNFNRYLVEKILEDQFLSVKFLTPVRIVHNSNLFVDEKSFTFFILLKHLLRRINLLSYSYSNDKKLLQERGFNIKQLLERSKAINTKQNNLYWFDWSRYSNRQNQRMKLGGFMGDITFEGDFSNFIPFLLFGELTHFGKNSTFGLGKYKIY